jgi:precorrin-6A synthase
MRRLFIIGIGTGDPRHLTVEAIEALNEVDVVFALDKGEEKAGLMHLREAICARYIRDRPYRIVTAPDPERDRRPASYAAAVGAWHAERAAIYERLIATELGGHGCGAFLVWGDPSLYDSTLRILDRVRARGAVAFEHRVIPGISSVQALAARHRIALNRIGEPVHITTGRRLAEEWAGGHGSVVVMLDGCNAYRTVNDPDVDIYWGAYLGTPDELTVAGKLTDVADEIERLREAARARHGWIMDIYLLRKP